MEEIKVGEYVRTVSGTIDKVVNNDFYLRNYIDCERQTIIRENITKHSPNIIGLIEVRRLCEWASSRNYK